MNFFLHLLFALGAVSLCSTVYAEKVVVIPLHSKATTFTDIKDQLADEQIPDAITRDSELTSTVTSVLTTHSDDSSAHHSRYTNGEAISAMGAQSDGNPLRHEKYTDSSAVAAIKGADGAGSGLDADLLDGQHASDIIDAAADEVRTPISACGLINAPGSYYLTGNLSCAGTGITITENDVTIDLMGFIIDGPGTIGTTGILAASHSNIEVRNGTVSHFGESGIQLSGANQRIINMRILSNGLDGVNLSGANHHIRGCTASDNVRYGLLSGDGSLITNNTTYNNGSIGIYSYNGSTVKNNTSYQNGGSGISGKLGTMATNNTVYENGTYGIYVLDRSTVIGNTVYKNTSEGIHSDYAATISNNTVGKNGTIGIKCDYGATVTNNTVNLNGSWGVDIAGSAMVTGNTIGSNNNLGTANEGGLKVGLRCLVKDNVLSYNKQNNIYVTGSDNSIEGNLLVLSGNGILFGSSGNFYDNNRASGNTANYNVGATTQTDGGNNISF